MKYKRGPKTMLDSDLESLLKNIVELMFNDLCLAIEAESAMKAANDLLIPMDLRGVQFDGAWCYTAIHNSLALNLSISLARLFEEPSKKIHHDHTDLASIPALVHFLSKPQSIDVLVGNARNWTPQISRMEDVHEKACRTSIEKIFNKYRDLTSSSAGKSALETLSNYRTARIAHSLHGKVIKNIPKYGELFLLIDFAEDIVLNAKLAIKGESHDLGDSRLISYKEAKAFWGPAFRGIKKEANKA